MEILDIHTHHTAPQPQAVIALRVGEKLSIPSPVPGQLYSVGIHPWDTTEDLPEQAWSALESFAKRPDVVAIGECGVDLSPHGGPLFRQLLVLKRHIELSEQLNKPLIIHDVKAHDILVGARRDLKPSSNWAIHGFRGKPEVAQMLLRAGFWLSFGPVFNPDALRVVPKDRILAETDDSPESIQDVIARLSTTLGEDLTPTIAQNTSLFLTPTP